jgi:hypothetical protein
MPPLKFSVADDKVLRFPLDWVMNLSDSGAALQLPEMTLATSGFPIRRPRRPGATPIRSGARRHHHIAAARAAVSHPDAGARLIRSAMARLEVDRFAVTR